MGPLIGRPVRAGRPLYGVTRLVLGLLEAGIHGAFIAIYRYPMPPRMVSGRHWVQNLR
jgi:hypothetical protein